MAGNAPRGGRRRRGGGRRRTQRFADINVTPFVDVMLVLLIVFMVTAPLLVVGVQVEMPKTEAKQLPTDQNPLTITIRADGVVFLQDIEVGEADLLPQLEALAREGFDSRIFIRADKGTDWDYIAKTTAKINTAGYRSLNLVTDTLDDGPAQ
jgi:biopolymer transport protein TolR